MFKEICLNTKSINPVEIAVEIMKSEGVNIHGPEHHILDGSALLTALHNAGMEFDLEEALDEMAARGTKMPGATCGMWGVCGSCSSVGAALAIVRGTGPLSDNQYYRDNMKVASSALAKMAEIGGPRCCKRNAFISISAAAEYMNNTYNAGLETGRIICEFSCENKQCIGKRCPFFK